MMLPLFISTYIWDRNLGHVVSDEDPGGGAEISPVHAQVGASIDLAIGYGQAVGDYIGKVKAKFLPIVATIAGIKILLSGSKTTKWNVNRTGAIGINGNVCDSAGSRQGKPDYGKVGPATPRLVVPIWPVPV